MAPSYKLTYFAIKALAEPARLIMKYGDIEFEDDRIEREQWPTIKQGTPFGQVPVLTVNGKPYNQSLAICRYLAKQVKLNGKDDLEDMEIDGIADTFNDLRAKCGLYYYESDAAVKESRKGPLYNEIIPFFLERLDKVAANNNGFLACQRLTWADMYFVGLIDYLNFITSMDLTAKYPNLQAVIKNVTEIPAIKKWIEVRPKTDM